MKKLEHKSTKMVQAALREQRQSVLVAPQQAVVFVRRGKP